MRNICGRRSPGRRARAVMPFSRRMVLHGGRAAIVVGEGARRRRWVLLRRASDCPWCVLRYGPPTLLVRTPEWHEGCSMARCSSRRTGAGLPAPPRSPEAARRCAAQTTSHQARKSCCNHGGRRKVAAGGSRGTQRPLPRKLLDLAPFNLSGQ
jgi:hypothetical protein